MDFLFFSLFFLWVRAVTGKGLRAGLTLLESVDKTLGGCRERYLSVR